MTIHTSCFKFTSPDWSKVLDTTGIEREEICAKEYQEKCKKIRSLDDSAKALQDDVSIDKIPRELLKKIIKYLFFGEKLPKENLYQCNPCHTVFSFPELEYVFKAPNPCSTFIDAKKCQKAFQMHIEEYVKAVLAENVRRSYLLDLLVVPKAALVFVEKVNNTDEKHDPKALYIEVEGNLPDTTFSEDLETNDECDKQKVDRESHNDTHSSVLVPKKPTTAVKHSFRSEKYLPSERKSYAFQESATVTEKNCDVRKDEMNPHHKEAEKNNTQIRSARLSQLPEIFVTFEHTEDALTNSSATQGSETCRGDCHIYQINIKM